MPNTAAAAVASTLFYLYFYILTICSVYVTPLFCIRWFEIQRTR
jgi:hypothetical protein